MKKQTKVLVAATLLTLGASFSALAASKGTWVLNDEGWQYADKDGEYVESQWCKSNGVDFWINDDEVLGSNEWVVEDVEDSEETREYYVQSDGSKTISAWKYLYDMNDEDEEGDEYWFYFDAKGRMLKNTSKKIDGQTYYFDADGHMLTGWIESTDVAKEAADVDTAIENLVYADENGAVVKSSWINVFPWTETDGYEGEDEEWYYTTSAGKINYNKQVKVDGLSYIFNAAGEMMTGWIVKDYDDNYTAATKTHNIDAADVEEAYYCDDDYGYVKKNGWKELDNVAGSDSYWYHFDKLGRAFMATDSDAIYAAEIDFVDGEDNELEVGSAIMVNSKKIDGVVYYFNEKAEMIDGFQAIGADVAALDDYYYLADGARKTGKVTLTDNNENDYTFYFGEKNDDGVDKYVAVTGNYKNYLYIKGQLITSDDSDSYRAVDFNGNGTIGAGDYIVNDAGKVQHKDNKDYGVGKFTFTEDDVIATVVE